MTYKGNIGLLYTKTYFNSPGECEKDEKGNYQLEYNNLNKHLNTLQNKIFLDDSSIPEQLGNLEFKLTTIYPGLLIGSGYSHEVSGNDALKLGFYFDYTTGLPCIPGSSVKGVLRDACEKDGGNYVKSIIEELADDNTDRRASAEIKKLAVNFLKDNQDCFAPIDKTKKLNDKNPSHFINSVFNGIDKNGKQLNLKQRDIFHDAFPIESFNKESRFLDNDYITHHPDPLKDPNPIQFLKILPLVMFRFDFKLTDNIMNKKLKLELFRQILLDLGIGAKTNVGYGQFSDKEFKKFQTTLENKKNHHHSSNPEINVGIPSGITIAKNEEIEATITKMENDYYYFQFERSDKVCIIRKKVEKTKKDLQKKGYNTELNIKDKIIVKFQNDYNNIKTAIQVKILPLKT